MIAPDMEAKMEDATDVVHRLGKKVANKNRQVIILFAQRRVKEEIWHRNKDVTVCKKTGFHFAEVLPWEEWEERERLWSQIEQAMQEGKQAYFRGPHEYIDGNQIEEIR